MTNPVVSVIIPVYNAEKYLRECLDSVANQTLKNIEIICVNDGSTDTSLRILNEYARKDRRIKILTKKNSNAGDARNAGLRVASGRYLSFLDADDFFDVEMLEKVVTKIEKTDSDIVVFHGYVYDNRDASKKIIDGILSKENLPEKKVFNYTDIKGYIFNTFGDMPWNKLYRHSFVKYNGLQYQSNKRVNDLYFTSAALVLAEKITTLPEPLVYYRKFTGVSSQDTNHEDPLGFYKAFHKLKEFLTQQGIYKEVERSFLNRVCESTVYNLWSQRTSYKSFTKLHNFITKNFEKEFNILGHKASYFYRERPYLAYETIVNTDREQLLFDEMIRYRKHIDDLTKTLDNREMELEKAYNSLSWRITKPLRIVNKIVRGHL